mgnify:CR=1 FL=1
MSKYEELATVLTEERYLVEALEHDAIPQDRAALVLAYLSVHGFTLGGFELSPCPS